MPDFGFVGPSYTAPSIHWPTIPPWPQRPQPDDPPDVWLRYSQIIAGQAAMFEADANLYSLSLQGSPPSDLCLLTTLVAAQMNGGKPADVAAAVVLMKAIKAATAPLPPPPTPIPPP